MNNLTLNSARKFGAIELVQCVDNKQRPVYNKQHFNYLLVLDFEATCWNKQDPDRGFNEIIEFPCILYDVLRCEILEEFHQYVTPVEKPQLSSFCRKLTGISQYLVDQGVPLGTCLTLFSKWIEEIVNKYGIALSDDIHKRKPCAFATWSDWDLGTCLFKECNRKRIIRREYFSQWIDVRALYKEHYLRRPKGLCGALSEVGLAFEGRQHSGLDDARNTAKLIGKMIKDGVLFRITKEMLQ